MAAVTAARSRSRLGGDFVSINVNPLDGLEPLDLQLRYWDDRHDNGMAARNTMPRPPVVVIISPRRRSSRCPPDPA